MEPRLDQLDRVAEMELGWKGKDVLTLQDRVVDIVCTHLGVNRELVTPQTAFQRDVEVDSLDFVEMMMEFEEEFSINIPDDEADKIRTVASAIEYIEREQSKR